MAEGLARRGVSPNAISIGGAVASIIAGAGLIATSQVDDEWIARGLWMAAAGLAFVRLLANMLDGMVAIATGRASPVGELYNEVPDRVSDVAILVGLGYAAAGWPALGWAAALSAVLTAYVRAAARVAGAPQDYRGPMAKPHRMFVVIVTGVFMGLSPASWRAEMEAAGWSPPVVALMIITIGGVVTMARRLGRAAAVLRGGDGRGPGSERSTA